LKSSILKYNFLIVLAALLFFVPFLGSVHLFDWDEINFAECAREMVVTGDYFSVKINYQYFWEKPPLFIWMQALSMNIFGVNEFAARIPNAIAGCISLLVFFNIGRKLIDEKFGLIWVLVYLGSFLPHFYFKSGIIDPWFNLFIFCGFYYFILFSNYNLPVKIQKTEKTAPNNLDGYKNQKNTRLLLLSAVFIGLGVLTKGPVAILIFSICLLVFWVIKKFQAILGLKQLIIFALTVASIGLLWFVILALTGNSVIIKEFIIYQIRLFNTEDSGHGGPFYYHWIILLIGCFPLSVFALPALINPKGELNADTPFQKHFKLWMLILFWVVLILFSIVKTKIVHYSSLCYFPLSFLAAYVLYKLLNEEQVWKKYMGILLIIISGIIGLVISALPFIDKYKQIIIDANIIKDKFAVENLKANVTWTNFEWLIGIFLIVGILAMILLINKNRRKQGLIGIFIICLLSVNMASLLIAPRIEKYTQSAAIEFYQYLQNKDCYIETIGFKSYAHLFYSQKKQPPPSINSKENRMYQTPSKDSLLKGYIDKPAYFVCKITMAEAILKDYPTLNEIYRKNGFVFFVREVK